ncbi:MAG: ATP-binding protein, partial [Pseudomonadota bacterium]
IVSITDETGNIIYVNDKFCEVSQYQREDLLGRNHRIVNSGLHSRDFFAEFWRTISSGKVWQGEIRNRKKDGTFYWVATTVVPFLNDAGKPYQYISIRTDITNQKIAEEALRKINDELEERVRARTADLDANNKQLDYYLRDLMRKNEENETFVYSVSHDLRSPLVNLQGFSQELIMVGQDIRKLFTEGGCPPEVQKRGLALLDEDMAGSIRFIQAGVMRLSNIIDALLRLSRAGRVEYQLQQIDLNPIIKRIIDSMSVIIAQRGATVTAMENLPAAWVDPAAAEQIFANLIGNALNYLDPKRPGKIEIGCRMEGEETADGRLNIYYVKDNGLGISEQAQTKLFRIFQRFHPGSAKGEGVGLAIVRRVIERHGGRISVESKEGEGTTFFVVLPAQQTKQAPVLSEDSLLAAAN